MTSLALLGLTLLPLDCAVVEVQGRRVVDDAWLDQQVARANEVFEPTGTRFVRRPTRSLPAQHAKLERRRDRNALAASVRPGVVNCFVVASLRDVHEPDRLRRGVHWRARGSHYVLVAAYAGPTVLAHELGHFFGNRKHPDVVDNIMSYRRGDGPPTFDSGQIRVVRRFRRRFLRTGELRSVPPPKGR